MEPEAVCQTLGQSFTGEMILYALTVLSGMGAIAQTDRFIPEGVKQRGGPVVRTLVRLWDELGGNGGESKNAGAVGDSGASE